MIPPATLRDVIMTLERTPNVCITFDRSQYRADGSIALQREGRGWLLHRYLAHVLGIPLAPFMLPGGCRTFGCMNPRHRIPSHASGTGAKQTCPNGHPYTPENTLPKGGARKCRQCRDDRNARRRTSTNQRKGWCRQGHQLTERNTYRWTDAQGRKHRRCRRCAIDRMRAYRRRP